MKVVTLRNRLALCAMSALVALFGTSAEAAVLLEGFQGSTNGGPWNYSATPGVSYDADSLSLSGAANSNNLATASLGSQSGDIFIKFTLNMPTGSVQRNDFITFWFNDATSYETNVPAIGLKGNEDTSNPANDDLMVRISGNTLYADDGVPNAGPFTVTLIGKLSQSGGSIYDTFELWVNPTSLNGAPDQVVTSTGYGSGTVNTIGIRTATLGAGQQFELSNLVVGTEVLDMAPVPEPASLALWGVGGLIGMAVMRKRRKAA